MKTLNVDQVLNLWLFSKIGVPKRVRPAQGKVTPTINTQATITVCVARVESMPSFCEPVLRIWLERPNTGIKDDAEFFGLMDFMNELEVSLRDMPIGYVHHNDENDAVKPVTFLTVAVVAEELGITPNNLVMRLNRRKTSFPFGSYKFEKHWFIHPMDITELRGKEEVA